MKISAELQSLVEERWIPFCSEAIDSILCFGFCVVTYKGSFPSILKQGMYRLKVIITDNEYIWKVFSTVEVDQEMLDCEVFSHFGMDPRIDGQ